VIAPLRRRFERMPHWAVKLLPNIWWHAPFDRQQLYLTFDDGPHPDYTPMILDLLERLQIRATFFLIGKHAERNPELVQRLARHHRLGNHTWNHPNLRRQNRDFIAQELAPTRKLLTELGGEDVRLFRPPYGAFGPTLARYVREHDQQMVLWDVLPWDFLPHRTKEEISHALLQHARGGSIIVLHDGHRCAEITRRALEHCIPILQQRGFAFEPLPAKTFLE